MFDLFAKKKKGGQNRSSPMGDASAVQRVSELSQRGFSEHDIIRTLRSEGYSPSDVDGIMNEALRSSIGSSAPRDSMSPPPRNDPNRGSRDPPIPGPEERMQGPPQGGHREYFDRESPRNVPELPDIFNDNSRPNTDEDSRDYPMPRPVQEPNPYPVEPDIPNLPPRMQERGLNRGVKGGRREELVELAEEVINEKWVGIESRISEIDSRFEIFDKRISEIEKMIETMKGAVSKKVNEATKKVEGYQSSVSDIGSKIDNMERVLKESIGPMMQTMRETKKVSAIKKPKEDETEDDSSNIDLIDSS